MKNNLDKEMEKAKASTHKIIGQVFKKSKAARFQYQQNWCVIPFHWTDRKYCPIGPDPSIASN